MSKIIKQAQVASHKLINVSSKLLNRIMATDNVKKLQIILDKAKENNYSSLDSLCIDALTDHGAIKCLQLCLGIPYFLTHGDSHGFLSWAAGSYGHSGGNDAIDKKNWNASTN